MEGLAGSSAFVLNRLCAGAWTKIDLFAAEHVAGLGEMNADLVGSSGLQAAFQDGVAGSYKLDGADVGDGQPGVGSGFRHRAAQAIAAVAGKVGAEGPGLLNDAMHDGHVGPIHLVGRELPDQLIAAADREGKEHQSGGIAVQAMDGVNRRWGGRARTPLPRPRWPLPRQHSPNQFIERGGQVLSLWGEVRLLIAPERLHAGGLFDNHQVRIDMEEANIGFAREGRGGMWADGEPLTSFEAPGIIEAKSAVHAHMPGDDQALGVGPGHFRDQAAQRRREGLAIQFGRDLRIQVLHAALYAAEWPVGPLTMCRRYSMLWRAMVWAPGR